MTNFAPRKWEYEESILDRYRVYEGDTEIASVQEEQNARLIASAPELYWMAYNLLFELKRGNASNSEYVKQAIPQIEDLLNRIKGQIKLKPCPFCGGIPYVISDKKNHAAAIKCPFCGARIEEYSTNGELEAVVKAWNRRELS